MKNAIRNTLAAACAASAVLTMTTPAEAATVMRYGPVTGWNGTGRSGTSPAMIMHRDLHVHASVAVREDIAGWGWPLGSGNYVTCYLKVAVDVWDWNGLVGSKGAYYWRNIDVRWIEIEANYADRTDSDRWIEYHTAGHKVRVRWYHRAYTNKGSVSGYACSRWLTGYTV